MCIIIIGIITTIIIVVDNIGLTLSVLANKLSVALHRFPITQLSRVLQSLNTPRLFIHRRMKCADEWKPLSKLCYAAPCRTCIQHHTHSTGRLTRVERPWLGHNTYDERMVLRTRRRRLTMKVSSNGRNKIDKTDAAHSYWMNTKKKKKTFIKIWMNASRIIICCVCMRNAPKNIFHYNEIIYKSRSKCVFIYGLFTCVCDRSFARRRKRRSHLRSYG